MKVALIGVGHWGKVLLEELSKLVEVKYQCDSKTDLNQVFDDPEIKVVFIATPTETHFDIASMALEAGKHVFVEKPATTSSSDLEKLVILAREKKVKLAVGYEFPHHPAVQKLKILIGNQEIKYLRFEWHKWGTFDHDSVAHLLCHDLSVAQFLGVRAKPISCEKVAVISSSDLLETKFENNLSSFINRVSPIKEKSLTILTGQDGYVWKDSELFEIEIKNRILKPIELEKATPVSAEIRDFLSAIAEDRAPLSNGLFALEVYRLIETVQALTLR